MGEALLVLLLVGAGYLALRSGSKPSKSTEPAALDPYIGEGDNVWLLGDSLATGIGPRLKKMAQDRRITLSQTARVGASTLWGTVQAQSPAAKGHTVWLVCLGANDAALPVPNANLEKWVDTIKRLAHSNGASIVWLVAPNGGGLPGYDRVFKTVMDVVPDVILPPQGLAFAPDGVHLFPSAYDEWAHDVWDKATSQRQDNVG